MFFKIPGSGLNSYTSSRWLFFLELDLSFFVSWVNFDLKVLYSQDDFISSKLLDRYYFWCENWYTWRHIKIWSSYLYLAGFQDQPPAASKWPDIIFGVRIEILTLRNLYLDMHEGILVFDLHICTWLASRISLQQPPSGQILFLMEELKSWP